MVTASAEEGGEGGLQSWVVELVAGVLGGGGEDALGGEQGFAHAAEDELEGEHPGPP